MSLDVSELDDEELELFTMQLVFGQHTLYEFDSNRAPQYWYDSFEESIETARKELWSRDEATARKTFVGAYKFLSNPEFDFEAVRRDLVNIYDVHELPNEEVADLHKRTLRQLLEAASQLETETEPEIPAEDIEKQQERAQLAKECTKVLSYRDFDYNSHRAELDAIVEKYKIETA